MRQALVWLVAILLATAGLLGGGAYVVAAFVTDDRAMLARDYGSVFAFSVVGAAAGVVMILALSRRLPATAKLPNEWLAFVLFFLAVGAGVAATMLDRATVVSPLMALIAAASLFVFIGRLVTKWSPER